MVVQVQSEFLRDPGSLRAPCWDVLLPFAVCWWDIITALAVRCMVGRLVLGTLSAWVRAGEVYFYGKLFGGTRPVVVGGVKRFWDHNRYHISGFWPRNRYHVECPGH